VSSLEELEAAFTRGDYRAVREGAAKLIASSDDEAEKNAARVLVERTTPPTFAKYMFLLAALLLALLTSYWLAESKKTHDVPQQKPASSAPR
jgi:hypothetical protein